ncbi:hypothetical protein S7335_3539 [Synechococcus sp. PCC 7335]|uniref:hypothetical protein n=1 Tax=Synechococcus sp. (strain ATCC 29403 / PCC 7335) TaxID=91464 RepID=UPI00017EBBBD|nr:hypothetical protein [Synechococcus sp. PCC 7335]EDX85836.1 hypothetical protein S7335_3539 [Synechococcus sp. PCC 7335]
MNNFLQVGQLITLGRLRRLVVLLIASLLIMLMATACTPSDTASSQSVPEATPADVQRAQSNLSEQAVDEDVLSQQGPSQARRSDSTSIQ